MRFIAMASCAFLATGLASAATNLIADSPRLARPPPRGRYSHDPEGGSFDRFILADSAMRETGWPPLVAGAAR